MDKVELINQIIELQRMSDRARRQYELDVWMNLPLTIGQLKSLFFIRNHGSTNLRKLAAALGVTPTNTTGIVDRLVKHGLISRTENPEDRRMLLLQPTPKGEELITKLRERRRDYMVEVLGHMSMDELISLSNGLTSLIKITEAQETQNKDENI